MFGHLYYSNGFKTGLHFQTEHGKACPFPSQIRSSIPAVGEMHLHLLVFTAIASIILTSKVMH